MSQTSQGVKNELPLIHNLFCKGEEVSDRQLFAVVHDEVPVKLAEYLMLVAAEDDEIRVAGAIHDGGEGQLDAVIV